MNKIFAWIFSRLTSKKKQEKIEVANPDGYISLTPIINDYDEDEKYCRALKWALQNRHVNRNIAITGPYGSGKSSIIKTFENANQGREFEFLNISLATFEFKAEDYKELEQKEKLLRLIEFSILQQIFYHEEDRDIPDSRFKKTRSFPRKQVISFSIFISAYVLSLILQLNPKVLQRSLMGWQYPEWLGIGVHYSSLLFLVIGAYFIVYRSIRPLRSIQLKKFNFQDAEFAVGENISKSILNDHLDEILYFFEVTEYNVVVIEDLDRFEQPEIFTKLRELNLLINYSKKTKRNVAFVYAVRDDMFMDRERAKFFDFIIPIVPVVNSANSEAILTRKVEEMEYGITADLIDNIALFVDDMRLLYNILNEYQIYSGKVKAKVANKLFGLIVYKNIYSKDFTKLASGEGDLYKAISEKGRMINEKSLEIQEEMEQLRNRIAEIEQIWITQKMELRKLYLLEYIKQHPGFVNFYSSSSVHTLEDMLEDELFNLLRNSSRISYQRFDREYNRLSNKNLAHNFSAIEKFVDADRTYIQRLAQVEEWNDGLPEKLKLELEEKQNDLRRLRSSTLQELMEQGTVSVSLPEDPKKERILNIMLRYGYIDENYFDYISIFHEGSLTLQDQEYLLNVRARIHTDFGHVLTKFDRLINRMELADFEGTHVYNYSLLDYLLINGSKEKRSAILKGIADESALSRRFFDGYISEGKELQHYIAEQIKYWPKFWNFIDKRGGYAEHRKVELLRMIIGYAENSEIVKLDADGSLSSFIASFDGFLSIIDDRTKLKALIKALNITFTAIERAKAPADMMDFVRQGNHYALKPAVMEALLTDGSNEQSMDFEEKNFTYINSSCGKQVREYVHSNLEAYVRDVLLTREMGGYDAEEDIAFLLNSEMLSDETKRDVVLKKHGPVQDLGKVKPLSVKQFLLWDHTVIGTWQTLADYFEEMEEVCDKYIIEFLQGTENIKLLTKQPFDKAKLDQGTEFSSRFLKSLFRLDELNDEAYQLLVGGLPYHYEKSFNFENLSATKISLLVSSLKIKLSAITYEGIRSNYDIVHIELAEQNPKRFIEIKDELTIDANDLRLLLGSKMFNVQQKNALISHLGDDAIIANVELCKALARLAASNEPYQLTNDVMAFLITDIAKNAGLLVKFFDRFDPADIMVMLEQLPSPYHQIAEKGKKPLLLPNELNTALADKLHKKGMISSWKSDKNGVRIYTFKP